jgi:hypothetical protein
MLSFKNHKQHHPSPKIHPPKTSLGQWTPKAILDMPINAANINAPESRQTRAYFPGTILNKATAIKI